MNPAQIFSFETLDEIPRTPTPYAVLGFPISRSLSRVFQNAAFEALKIPAIYYAIETKPEQLSATIAKLKEKKFGGWNCTLPLKIDILPLLDEISSEAKILGAVNTVLNRNGKLTGFNTDAQGWVEAVREEFDVEVKDLRIMILGAGGAGRALAIQAAREGCRRLVLVNRTVERAENLKREIENLPHEKGNIIRELIALPFEKKRIEEGLKNTDLLVNATSAEMNPAHSPLLDVVSLPPSLLVYDTIYQPLETPLLQQARAAGARGANGLSMLLHQGAAAFKIWTGKPAPLEVMRHSLESVLHFQNKKSDIA